ncbi:hypothetical protein BCR34DRAFT_624863 [Clohesyomyces aquaticus]|uniref:RING-type domain-containing protein n=1 Tax=Clohesyomyces aquaticus TaxID=1231657 RepID=A0A1Y1ZMD9_9PLEO|nr:hypothetical protein BCR34DRAFT_624863 [Clohesyomyces aquaticus]
MSSVFASIVRPPKPARLSSTTDADTPREADADPRQPTCTRRRRDSDEPDLRDLNNALQALTDIFPDIQPEVFREMLGSFSEESRLEVITETLLKNSAKWVRGRYRMPAEQEEQRATAHTYKYRSSDSAHMKDTRGAPLALEDTFRSRKYREAAKEALYSEFKGLSHSTIKAVLAEYNWNYTQARPTLLGLVQKSWRYSITSFLMRRKAPSAKDHPLVVWTSADAKAGRPAMPMLVSTRSHELNKELHDSLIFPVLEQRREEQMQRDWELANELNEAEAEEAGEMYDCECCFIPNTLEQMSACDTDGHYICFRCIRQAINAALYDQGWNRNIDTERCTLRCIAPISTGTADCTGCIPMASISLALLSDSEKNGLDTLTKLNDRLATDSLLKSRLPLIRCPFCHYAEVDELSLPNADLTSNLRFRLRPLLLTLSPISFTLPRLLILLVLGLAFRFVVLALFLFTTINYMLPSAYSLPLYPTLRSALHTTLLRRRGLRFVCASPLCSRSSCLRCSAPWHDPHECFSSQLTSLRLTLERAETEAVKRTCPQCNLGFVKSEGCNKLVCLCGYAMCYVCREGLGNEGYGHFCQHFRERPGESCGVCGKCDLYKTEGEDGVRERARREAEGRWWEQQGGEGKGKGVESLEKLREGGALGIMGEQGRGWWGGLRERLD